MAVVSKGTGSDSLSFNKVTGILKVKDVIVNPTVEEAKKYGINWMNEEPEYVKTTEKGKQLVITFFFKVDNDALPSNIAKGVGTVTLSHRVYVDDFARVSKDGRTEFINYKGSNLWGTTVQDLPNEFTEGNVVRPRYNGEEKLMDFLRAWGDVRGGDVCVLDTIPQMFEGDFSELKALEKEWNTHKFKAWVGLKDSGDNKFNYVVYPKLFWRVYATNMRLDKIDYSFKDGLKKYEEKDSYNRFKADIQSIEPKMWLANDLKSITPSPEPMEAPQSTEEFPW